MLKERRQGQKRLCLCLFHEPGPDLRSNQAGMKLLTGYVCCSVRLRTFQTGSITESSFSELDSQSPPKSTWLLETPALDHPKALSEDIDNPSERVFVIHLSSGNDDLIAALQSKGFHLLLQKKIGQQWMQLY